MIVTIWEAHVAADPTDADGYLTLAVAYYELGNSAKAIQVLKTLAQTIPSSADKANGFITQINAGTLGK